ncbi:MAG: GHMP kinase [Candidatus Eisenbacteria bacterium]|nr:GHMP kinase [Candidatus Eisenbacteria bacterium]
MSRPIFRARAPLRISFCGGGTDVSPYPERHGGVVLSVTIDKYAYATLRPKPGSAITLTSLDYDVVAKYRHSKAMQLDGNLDLVKQVVKRMSRGTGLELFLHSDAPPGSGLGSSSTLVVALIGAFLEWRSRPLTDYGIAELAYKIEREDLRIAGGRQDQYAATFGGFNFIEFFGDRTVVNPLRIRPAIVNELQYRLLLCYTGQSRLSSSIIRRQTRSFVRAERSVVKALHELRTLTADMKDALLLGRLERFGELLHEAWLHKRRLDPQISNSSIDEMYAEARRRGATGGKILGAGGGGYLLLFCRFDRKHRIAAQLEKMGGQVVEFSFESQGLQSWVAG